MKEIRIEVSFVCALGNIPYRDLGPCGVGPTDMYSREMPDHWTTLIGCSKPQDYCFLLLSNEEPSGHLEPTAVLTLVVTRDTRLRAVMLALNNA